jgi:hypothetical protein
MDTQSAEQSPAKSENNEYYIPSWFHTAPLDIPGSSIPFIYREISKKIELYD